VKLRSDWGRTGFYDANKRLVDIVFSVIGLTLFAPIFALAAAFIKLESSGPVIYEQKRVGLNGKIFTIYKIRTMETNAEEQGATWASKYDTRITVSVHSRPF